MDKNTRFEVRNQGNGWSTVTVKKGFESTTEVFETYKVRTNAETLVKVSAKAKAKGAQGVSWGACSSRYWVGLSF